MDSLIAMNEQRKRTWAQAQELKKVARKGRGFFSPRKEARNRVKRSRKPRQPPHQSTVPTDCDGTPRDLRARLRPENWTATEWRDRLGHGAVLATGTLEVLPGHLIVDSAAGQAMIGETACVKWEQKSQSACLRGERVHTKMATPKGVGGAAHPTRSMMMPTMIDSLPGVLQYTVVEEDIPGLLPLSFQEKQGALISEGTNKLHLPRLSKRLPICTAHQDCTVRLM